MSRERFTFDVEREVQKLRLVPANLANPANALTLSVCKISNVSSPLPSKIELSKEWKDLFEERAGILEYEACFMRAEAEERAATDIFKFFDSREIIFH